jgi:hypothetical protein
MFLALSVRLSVRSGIEYVGTTSNAKSYRCIPPIESLLVPRDARRVSVLSRQFTFGPTRTNVVPLIGPGPS